MKVLPTRATGGSGSAGDTSKGFKSPAADNICVFWTVNRYNEKLSNGRKLISLLLTSGDITWTVGGSSYVVLFT